MSLISLKTLASFVVSRMFINYMDLTIRFNQTEIQRSATNVARRQSLVRESNGGLSGSTFMSTFSGSNNSIQNLIGSKTCFQQNHVLTNGFTQQSRTIVSYSMRLLSGTLKHIIWIKIWSFRILESRACDSTGAET
nr:hypothetical protein [Tanacetum cinerariifolium]